jgi:hypothetical protein
MSSANEWFYGTHWYNEPSLLARLVEPYPVEFIGPWDFNLQNLETHFAEIKIGPTSVAPVYTGLFALGECDGEFWITPGVPVQRGRSGEIAGASRCDRGCQI